MRNQLDKYVGIYQLLWYKTKLLSMPRFLIRRKASQKIPKWLSAPYTDRNILKASEYLGERGINKSVIVSLTSFPARINEVWQVIECMKRQSIKPDKIFLWLSRKQFPEQEIPVNLSALIDDTFEVVFVDDDYKSHKKYYYAFSQFPNDLIVLLDDDIYYPTNTIELFIREYLLKPNCIYVRYGCEMKFDKKGKLLPYNDWWHENTNRVESYSFFFGSGGGTMVCPSLLNEDVLNIKVAMDIAPSADDVWLNAMALLSHMLKIKIQFGIFLPVAIKNNEELYVSNVFDGQNDLQIKKVQDYCYNKYQVDVFSLGYLQSIDDKIKK